MSHAPGPQRRILIDMTPLGAQGSNGGAGLVATSLVEHLARLAPWFDITCLTADVSHAELASLDADNVHRRCVVAARPAAQSLARRLVDKLVPPRARDGLKQAFYSLRTARRYAQVADDLQPDLLFCPFTVPYFWRAGVACVSIVYDLQHVSHPEFFSAEQHSIRQRQIHEACSRSDRVVCISEYVRHSLLANVEVCPERVVSVPLGLLNAPARADARVLDRLALRGGEFLLYPANFWPHKNHRALFEGLRRFRSAHPDSKLRLVCSGAPNALMRSLAREAPEDLVMFAGYVSSQELAALLDASAALIFPTLYEGFGMPVLEAMDRGRPVLCSRVASLPEVAGDAAVYFDPTDPSAIAVAIATLEDRPRVIELVERGRLRARAFGTARDMASRYLEIFERVFAASV